MNSFWSKRGQMLINCKCCTFSFCTDMCSNFIIALSHHYNISWTNDVTCFLQFNVVAESHRISRGVSQPHPALKLLRLWWSWQQLRLKARSHLLHLKQLSRNAPDSLWTEGPCSERVRCTRPLNEILRIFLWNRLRWVKMSSTVSRLYVAAGSTLVEIVDKRIIFVRATLLWSKCLITEAFYLSLIKNCCKKTKLSVI